MSDTLNLGDSFNVPAYADLVVHFGPDFAMETVYCHKVIVCPQSPFFRNACAARNATGKLVVFTISPVHDYRAVEAVLMSLYHTRETTYGWLQTCAWDLLFQVYELARVLGIEHLLAPTAEAIMGAIQELEEAQHEVLVHVYNIVAASPTLKEVVYGEPLQEVDVDEAARLLGEFTIG